MEETKIPIDMISIKILYVYLTDNLIVLYNFIFNLNLISRGEDCI